MNKCRDCKHWGSATVDGDDDYRMERPVDPDTGEPMNLPFMVRRCDHPAVHRFERPTEINGCALLDGSDYYAALYTAEEFGCVRWEPKAA